jgi:hypothetical protein
VPLGTLAAPVEVERLLAGSYSVRARLHAARRSTLRCSAMPCSARACLPVRCYYIYLRRQFVKTKIHIFHCKVTYKIALKKIECFHFKIPSIILANFYICKNRYSGLHIIKTKRALHVVFLD